MSDQGLDEYLEELERMKRNLARREDVRFKLHVLRLLKRIDENLDRNSAPDPFDPYNTGVKLKL